MPYTTIEQVRSHLVTNAPLSRRVYDQAVLIDSNDPIPFFDGSIAAGTFVVKGIRTHTHVLQNATVAPSVGFSGSPVVPGSVVAANDSSLGLIYAESVDYVIDYAAGKLTPISTGSLVSGAGLTIWYLPYTVYVDVSDYHANLERGEIRRSTSGDIAIGETVFFDYSPVHLSIADSMALAAVTTANGLVERAVDPAGQFEADPMLGLAATYKALEILCRAAAARDLSFVPGQDRSARAWMQLAADYAARADSLLASFRPPIAPLAAPTLS
jgi:hypothetical protein